MLARLKNSFLSVAVMTAILAGSSLGLGAPNANAGLILAPAGVGIIILIVGLADNSLGLVILSNPDGTLKMDSLTTDLMNRYQRLGIDSQTASDLGSLIGHKYQIAKTAGAGQIHVNFSKEELAAGLRASNIEADNPALFNQLVSDFK